jgi:hypothetical protein
MVEYPLNNFEAYPIRGANAPAADISDLIPSSSFLSSDYRFLVSLKFNVILFEITFLNQWLP